MDSGSTRRMADIGVVVIGRNEGERLERCLRSLVSVVRRVVYVDSGSTDGSVEFAESLGVDVVSLDMSQPFTMARGRNEGFRSLVHFEPHLPYVQFVDGDCEVVDGWLTAAKRALDARADVAVVCGRRRERYPDATIYNRLCEIEWDSPVGEVRSCGGDAMIRRQALQQVGGFKSSLIAGEEAELCFRLRERGWRVLRIGAEMTLHDAAIGRFSQCWKRCVRSGHAYAEGASLHGKKAERHHVRHVRSALFWGVVVPCLIVAASIAAIWQPWALIAVAILAAGYPVLWSRIYRRRRRRGDSRRIAALFSSFCVVTKLPHSVGIAVFAMNRLRGRRTGLIEYKTIDQRPKPRPPAPTLPPAVPETVPVGPKGEETE